MVIDPRMLEQALRTPETQDVTDTPIVRGIILADPANAADLVPYLARPDSLQGRNALRILCQFDSVAVPILLDAIAASASPIVRTTGLAAMWAMFVGESLAIVREHLAASAPSINLLLADRSPLPDEMPDHIERDFRGRVCDMTYVVVNEIQNPEFDQSTFRGMNDQERDRAIRQLQARGFGGLIV
jgi:hypothetical protein